MKKKTKKFKTITFVTLAVMLVVASCGAALATEAHAATVAKPKITVTRAATGKVTIKQGSSYKLKAKSAGAKLTYKTSKKKVCKVSSKGKLIAKKCGKVTITIKAKKNGLITTKKIKVTIVKKSKYKKVKKIAIKGPKTISAGYDAKLKVTFKPVSASNKNVTYKSSNPDVATVSATGKVTANKTGTAKITATSCDGSKKVTFNLKVTAHEHEWKYIEPTILDSHQVTSATYVICYCGQKFAKQALWREHSKAAGKDTDTCYGYRSGSDEEIVYNLSPAYYECTGCGTTKQADIYTIDGEKLEKVTYNQCACGNAFFKFENIESHKSVRDDTHTYTIEIGYRFVS